MFSCQEGRAKLRRHGRGRGARPLLAFVFCLHSRVTLATGLSPPPQKGDRVVAFITPRGACGPVVRDDMVSSRANLTRRHLFGFGGNNKPSEQPAENAATLARIKSCKVCSGTGAVDCEVCKGTGIDKKGGNVFERFKCMKCQGFGYVNCKACNPRGLTPEQRGER